MGKEPNYALPDEEVVSQIKQGRTGLYAVLVKRYQDRIYSIGMRFFHNEDDSSDFVQEVFIKAYRGLGSFKGRGLLGESKFSSWLLKIAYNHGINALNRGKRYESLSESCEPVSGEDVERQQIKRETGRALEEALKELPEKYAICLDLYFFYGVSYPEISEVTGFPVNTIKSHVFRAKGLLRKRLRGTIAEDYHEV